MCGEDGGCRAGQPARGLPRIAGIVTLLDAASLLPLAIIDGAAVTTLRTPAASAVAARSLLVDGGPASLPLFGSRPQAAGHVRALNGIMALRQARIAARDGDRAGALAAALAAELQADVAAGDAADIGAVDVIVYTRTAADPVFDVAEVRPGALVIAGGFTIRACSRCRRLCWPARRSWWRTPQRAAEGRGGRGGQPWAAG